MVRTTPGVSDDIVTRRVTIAVDVNAQLASEMATSADSRTYLTSVSCKADAKSAGVPTVRTTEGLSTGASATAPRTAATALRTMGARARSAA